MAETSTKATLLFSNMDNIGLSMDTNEQILTKLEEEALQKNVEPDTTINRTKENCRAAKAQKVLEAARKNPTLANKMYQLRSQAMNELANEGHAKLEDGRDAARFGVNETGDIYLQITKKMEGGSSFDYAIHDGKVILPAGMSDDKLLEALDFLYRRGITNFEMPPEQRGTDFNKLYERVQRQREAAPQAHMAAAPEPENAPYNPLPIKYTPKEQNKKEDADLDGEMDKWATTLGKIKNRGYHKKIYLNSSIYSFYQDNSTDYNKDDGVTQVDKKGRKKDKEEGLLFRVKITTKGDMSYYVPKNGKIPDNLADKLVALAKKQGSQFLDLSDIPETDGGPFREACARAGIIPRGINITERHVTNKMLPEAEKQLSEADLYKYKGQLGRHLLTLAQNDPSDRRTTLANQLINQEKLYPIKKKILDGALKERLEERITGGEDGLSKAEEVIGAAKTIDQMYTSISKEPNISINNYLTRLAKLSQTAQNQDGANFAEELKNTVLLRMVEQSDIELTEEQRRDPLNHLSKEQKDSLLNLQATKMDDETLLAIYGKLESKNIANAKNNLINKIRSNDKKAPDDVVSQEVNNAQRDLEKNLNKELTDKGFNDKFSIGSFGSPTLENAETYRQTNTRNLNRNTSRDDR